MGFLRRLNVISLSSLVSRLSLFKKMLVLTYENKSFFWFLLTLESPLDLLHEVFGRYLCQVRHRNRRVVGVGR